MFVLSFMTVYMIVFTHYLTIICQNYYHDYLLLKSLSSVQARSGAIESTVSAFNLFRPWHDPVPAMQIPSLLVLKHTRLGFDTIYLLLQQTM